ncbi:MAG: PaaI family thioesterase [Anaerolineae bacterium]
MSEPTRQPDSSMCFVCGRDNPIGLHLQFYVEEGRVKATFTPQPQHQGWPGILHGGITSTILDETVGRTCFLVNMWAVTARFQVRYLKPIPIGETVTVTAAIVRQRSRGLEARGEIRLADGTVAAEAEGTYIRIPDSRRRELEQVLDLR